MALAGPTTDLAAQTDSVTISAVSAGAPSPFPTSANGFEYSAVTSGQFLYGPNFPNGPGSWSPWTMNAGTGISSNGSAFTGTQAAPRGTRVALVQGAGSMSAPFTFSPGHWRLRFHGAQRQNNGQNRQVLRILVGALEVFEAELQGTSYQPYTTRTFTMPGPGTTSAVVTIQGTNVVGDHTAFVDWMELEPVADWQTAASWSPAQVPGPNNPVVIPALIEVAVTGAAAAASVTVNGELVTSFADASLDTRWVALSGSGAAFEVGRERTPYQQNFTLNLLGTGPNENVMGAGTKFLMAMDGATIDMHGIDKCSWTKLTSLPTATQITVLDHTGWNVGDEIVVAYTGHVPHLAGWPGICTQTPYDGPRSQRRTITAIDPLTSVITLASSLNAADHCAAAPLPYGGPAPLPAWLLDQRAEVGMLTRNVRIRGSATTDGFGGHVMIMACCPLMGAGLGRFANVELDNMGQKQQLGRYPLHWHMVRNLRPGQYVRNSSIHDSHNRAITVHGSHEITIERNVCFDTLGHAVFLEDGVEQDNLLVGNLVLATRKPGGCEQMLAHDNSLDEPQNRSPAAFWISNPANHFIGNVAADSLGVGYWFAIHEFPTGKSTEPQWAPQFPGFQGIHANLGTFADNVAHSLKMGVDLHDSVADAVGAKFPRPTCIAAAPVFCNGQPTSSTLQDPTDDDIATNVQWRLTSVAHLTGFTVYGCSTGLYSGGGVEYVTQIQFENCVLADNGVHVQFASAELVKGSVLVHDSGNHIFPTGNPPLGNGMSNAHLFAYENGNAYVVYDGPGRMFDNHLVGYDGVTQANLVFSEFGAARRHTNHLFGDLTFAGGGVPAIVYPNFADFVAIPPTSLLGQPHIWGIAIRDLSGCLSGGAPPSNAWSPFGTGPQRHTLITNHPMMHLSTSTTTPDIQAPYLTQASNAWLSPFQWGHLQVRYFDAQGQYDPTTGLYPSYLWLGGNDMPGVAFVRRTYQGWPRVSFDSSSPIMTQMRQLPVIVRPANTNAPECVYEVQITDLTITPNPPPTTIRRADISLDDADAGDIARLIITHASLPGWTPALRINDNPAYIHQEGQDPNALPPLSPSPPGTTTSYQLTTLGGATAIDLRLVNPGRTHRITITW